MAKAFYLVNQASLRGVLLDMDGVLYNAEQPIPGGPETVGWLRDHQIPVLFVTNTSSQPRSALIAKLAGFGIRASEAEVLTPIIAAASWLESQAVGPVALFVREASRVDFGPLPLLPPDAERGAGAVVIGDLGGLWDYRTLNRAFRLLHDNPQAVLIALGKTRYWLSPDGLALDVAPFVAALENATGRQALVFGKPAPGFFEAAVRLLGLQPEQMAMVGDDIQADVAGAQGARLKGVLVRTGKFRARDLDGPTAPDAILESIAGLPDWWRANAATTLR
jgi:phospholysine phosphohistidine inorganic pyrophosphate phosphatase